MSFSSDTVNTPPSSRMASASVASIASGDASNGSSDASDGSSDASDFFVGGNLGDVITIENVSKVFKGGHAPALHNLSTVISPGFVTGLVGPDGAGKTTLMRLLVGLMQPSNGTIRVHGFDSVKDAEEIHKIVGYMPQQFGLYEELSVIENLRLYADLYLLTKAQKHKKFAELLQFTDLERFQKRLARNLSGGMKQKLGLACALLGTPKILLLDEPSVGVDPISRRELWSMVQALLVQNIAVVWSTAYLDEAEKCHKVILLNQGKKIYEGSPNDVLQRVQGRTWQLQGIDAKNKRATLRSLLEGNNCVDGIIQGSYIRLVTKTVVKPPAQKEGSWHLAEPRFEDAFMDILGGISGGTSALAQKIPAKPATYTAIIDAHGLTKKFGDFVAVRDNTFQVHRGEIFGLLGPNGAGKSTTFKMMCGLLQPTQGQAFVAGLDLKTATSKARSRIGYMAQKFSLYGQLNVLQNLNFFAEVYGLHGKEQKEQVALMVDIFGFTPFLQMNASLLSLGYQKRLSLACAVMHQPDVLFLDEPTSGVDPITRREFWVHINGMVEKGVAIMVTTHFMDEAEYCDRIALIYRGENVATGTPDDLKKSVCSNNLAEPTLEDAFIQLIGKSDKKHM